MVDVRPFRGVRFDSSMVGDLSKVLCPPYDIISPSQARSLGERSPHNVVRLELPEALPDDTAEETSYNRAAAQFQSWLERGVLSREPFPAMYLVEEEFSYRGKNIRRQGLMAAVRLMEFEKGVVMPHEYTTPIPKADRLALMEAAHTNFSSIMCLYRDADGEVDELLTTVPRGRPIATAQPPDMPRYTMWTITEAEALSRIQDAMGPRQLFVADGHHRYETALVYRDQVEAAQGSLPSGSAARFVMMTLVSMADPGLLVLPYHRLLGGLDGGEVRSLKSGLERAFEFVPFDIPSAPVEAARTIEAWLAQQPKDAVVVAALGLEPGKADLLTLRDAYKPAADAPPLNRCDMWVLRQQGIRASIGEERESESVTFVHDATEAVESVLRGENQVAFLLRPLPLDLFEEVVSKGERLPPKSTYFYPKLPTGLVINSLEGEL